MEKAFLRVFFLLTFSLFVGCGGGGGSSSNDATSSNFPYLLSAPQVSFVRSSWDGSRYDVTVTVEATGPNPIYAVSLWIESVLDGGEFDVVDLEHIGGTTWRGTTYYYTPLPPDSYYVDNIQIEDGDAYSGEPYRSGWYFEMPWVSTSNYYIDQRLNDPYSADPIPEYNSGLTAIPIAKFTLP